MPQSLVVKDANNTNQTILHAVPGVAGTPSADVTSVQGVAGGVAIPVSGPVTDAQLRAAAVPVSGPATNAELRATPLPVSIGSSVPVTGPATNAELRASALPVSGPLTDAQLRAAAVPVSGPATDAQMRATPLAVASTPTNGSLADRSGTITAANTAQNAIAANASRRGFSVQNLHATDPLYFNQSGTATTGAGSTKLAAGAYFESPVGAAGVAAVSVLSATAGLAFTAKEW
jgi:hypothetical protein